MIWNRYRTLVVFVGVVIFASGFSEYSQKFGIIPLLWIMLLAGMTAPLVIPALFTQRVFVPPIAVWGAVYLLISILWYPLSPQNAAAFRDMRTRLLSIIFLGLMLFLLSRPRDQRTARIAVACSVMLAVALNIVDLLHPLTFSQVPGRSSGFYPNVNQAGAALVLGFIVSYGIVPQRLKILFMGATAIGIMTTFSRGAIVGFVLVLIYLAFRAGLNVAQARRVLVLCLVVAGFFASPYWSNLEQTLQERGALNLDVLQRLNFLSKGDTSDASAQEREQLARIAWRRFAQRPYLGWGTSDDRQIEGAEVGIHNIYLAMMVDHGIIGIFFLPTFILATIWGFRSSERDIALPFAMFLLLWGFFSHNVFEERYLLVAVALTASLVASARMAAKPAPALEPAPLLHAIGAPA